MASPRKSAGRFRERSELLDFLLEVSAATSETLDLDRLLANVADIVKKVIDCELFAILLYTEKYQQLRIRFAVGHRPEIVNNLTLTLQDGITGAAATRPEPLLLADVPNHPPYLTSTHAPPPQIPVPIIP